jgi:hypothetical protein
MHTNTGFPKSLTVVLNMCFKFVFFSIFLLASFNLSGSNMLRLFSESIEPVSLIVFMNVLFSDFSVVLVVVDDGVMMTATLLASGFNLSNSPASLIRKKTKMSKGLCWLKKILLFIKNCFE